jgi:hypothetical protein
MLKPNAFHKVVQFGVVGEVCDVGRQVIDENVAVIVPAVDQATFKQAIS